MPLDYLPYAVAVVILCFLFFGIRWLIAQAKLGGQATSQAEVARLTERTVALEANEAKLDSLNLQFERLRHDAGSLLTEKALAGQAIREKDKRIEALEEADAHRQLYVSAELEKASASHQQAHQLLETDRDILRRQMGELRETLATRTAEVDAKHQQININEAELSRLQTELPPLRNDLQAVSANYARVEQVSLSQVSVIRNLQVESAETKQELRTHSTDLQAARTRLAELQEQLQSAGETKEKLHSIESERADLNVSLAASNTTIGGLAADVLHLRERAAVAEETLRQRDAKLAEQQAAVERSLAEQAKATQLRQSNEQLLAERDGLRLRYDQAATDLAALTAELTAERQQTGEKLNLLTSAKEQLSDQFRAIAAEILKHNTQQFAEQNQQRLGDLLNPLKTQLTLFQSKVEQVHHEGTIERAGLREQVNSLSLLNQTLSSDARNLTKALKGESKVQGDWGEMILERVLELSGLREGEEYIAQKSHQTEDGGQLRPDVIINLPDSKSLIVDAKVSLKAYEAYSSADTDAQRDLYFKQHLDSIRTHIRGLSEKNYPALPGTNSIAFVVMFVPLEPAFSLAMARDSNIWQEAWKRNVMLVSPSTLMFVVRTVSHLWQQESQTRNSREIARQGAGIYDKLVGFVEDMDRLGRTLEKATESYQGAVRKLSTGKGNLITQADKLKRLGVPSNKSFPDQYQTLIAMDDAEDSATAYGPLNSENPFRPQ